MENSLNLEYCKNYNNWCEKRSCKNCYYEGGYNMSYEEKEIIETLKSIKDYETISFIDIIKLLYENREKINEIIDLMNGGKENDKK